MADEDRSVRLKSVVALARIGPDAKAAVPALTEALKNRDPDLREEAAKALGHIGPDAKTAVPVLIRALKDKVDGVRRDAVVALGCIGPDAKAAVPELAEALKDEDGCMGRRVAEAIKDSGKSDWFADHIEFIWDDFQAQVKKALQKIAGRSDTQK